jgi:polyisoprenoid-binding protein YceI
MRKRPQLALIIILILIIIVGIILFGLPKGKDNLNKDTKNYERNTTSTVSTAETITGDHALSLLTTESQLNWTASKQIGGAHTGNVMLKSGAIEIKDGRLTSGKFVIDMKNITVTDLPAVGAEQLVKHLNNEDFFMVDTYPEANIEIAKVNNTDENTFDIKANLTIKGQTHPITITAKKVQTPHRVFIKSGFSIDRTKWGIKYGSGKFFDNLGDNMIKDEIDFTIALAFENPMNDQKKSDTPLIGLNSRIEGGNINVEKVSIEATAYKELSSRIEGGSANPQQKISLPTQTEYKSLSSRIE